MSDNLANERFEIIGDLYFRHTGFMRPGKDSRNYDTSSPENRERFDQWRDDSLAYCAVERLVQLETVHTELLAALEWCAETEADVIFGFRSVEIDGFQVLHDNDVRAALVACVEAAKRSAEE
jgi:hypothetical protein